MLSNSYGIKINEDLALFFVFDPSTNILRARYRENKPCALNHAITKNTKCFISQMKSNCCWRHSFQFLGYKKSFKLKILSSIFSSVALIKFSFQAYCTAYKTPINIRNKWKNWCFKINFEIKVQDLRLKISRLQT